MQYCAPGLLQSTSGNWQGQQTDGASAEGAFPSHGLERHIRLSPGVVVIELVQGKVASRRRNLWPKLLRKQLAGCLNPLLVRTFPPLVLPEVLFGRSPVEIRYVNAAVHLVCPRAVASTRGHLAVLAEATRLRRLASFVASKERSGGAGAWKAVPNRSGVEEFE
eukprot:UN4539